MTYEFTIPGKLPSLNDFISAERTNRYKGAQMKRTAQDRCSLAIYKAIRGVKITKKIRIHYIFYEKNTRRDLDNISGFAHKVIQDALVMCGVIKDDGWKNIVSYTDTFAIDREDPRIVVMLEEVD